MTPDSITMESIPAASYQKAFDASREGPKKSLLSWVSKAIPSNLGIEVKDFGPSWRDGYAFMGLINAVDDNLIDIENYRNVSNKSRLHTSFNVAETQLGIPKLLDPDDVDLPKPDERSVMTYVAQFLHKYPEAKVRKVFNLFIQFLTFNFIDHRRSHQPTVSKMFKVFFSGYESKSSSTIA